MFMIDNDKYEIPNFIETVYKMSLDKDINKMCTGQIQLTSKGEIITERNFVPYRDNKIYDVFIDEFHKRLSETDCKFTGLGINYRDEKLLSHYNMLFIYRDTEYKKRFVFLYEPHGIYKDQRMSDDIKNFILFIEDKYNEKYGNSDGFPIVFVEDVLGDDMINQPRGIQIIVNEEEQSGYCVMYCYFWLYLVLSCYYMTKEDPLKLILYIEQTLTKKYTAEQLKKIIVSFAVTLVNFYIEELNRLYILDQFNKEVHEIFEKYMTEFQTYKKETKTTRKEERGDIGDKCVTNSECISNYCEQETKTCKIVKKRTKIY
jgi:hypothetical protein